MSATIDVDEQTYRSLKFAARMSNTTAGEVVLFGTSDGLSSAGAQLVTNTDGALPRATLPVTAWPT